MGATAALTESGQMAVMDNTVLQKNEPPQESELRQDRRRAAAE